MNKATLILALTSIFVLSGCVGSKVPQSVASNESGYAYIPIDPFPVLVTPGANCVTGDYDPEVIDQVKYKPLLESLPDNAVRMSIEQFDTEGNVTYGPAGIGATGESYRVTVDYVNSDTANFPILIAKTAKNRKTNEIENVDLFSPVDEEFYYSSSASYVVRGRYKEESTSPKLEYSGIEFFEYSIPVYVGVGLRVTANVDIVGSSANISGLGVIGAEAELNSLKGSLIVQTLGINGKSIAAALPIQSELNRTTAQNAIVSVGSIKALLYDNNTATAPRVVGIYLPFPGGKTVVNAIISELSKGKGIEWRRPCAVKTGES